jgi:hypothetical protein
MKKSTKPNVLEGLIMFLAFSTTLAMIIYGIVLKLVE